MVERKSAQSGPSGWWARAQNIDWIRAARTLWQRHWRYLMLCLVFVGLVLLFAWWSIRAGQGDTDGLVIATAGSAVLGSVLAALLVEVIDQYREILADTRNQQEFRRFFGIPANDSKVAIILPEFEMVQQKWKDMGEGGILMPLTPTPTPLPQRVNVNVRCDIWAASQLISVFGELGLPSPTILSDISMKPTKLTDESIKDESIKMVDMFMFGPGHPFSQYDVLIAIGLYSNYLVMWANHKQYAGTLFGLRYYNTVKEGGDNKRPSAEILLPVYEGGMRREIMEKANKDDSLEYGLIAKTRLHLDSGPKTLFVVGGIEESGTEQVSEYLAREWRDLLQRVDTGTQNQRAPMEKGFAIFARMPKEKQFGGALSIERVCT